MIMGILFFGIINSASAYHDVGGGGGGSTKKYAISWSKTEGQYTDGVLSDSYTNNNEYTAVCCLSLGGGTYAGGAKFIFNTYATQIQLDIEQPFENGNGLPFLDDPVWTVTVVFSNGDTVRNYVTWGFKSFNFGSLKYVEYVTIEYWEDFSDLHTDRWVALDMVILYN